MSVNRLGPQHSTRDNEKGMSTAERAAARQERTATARRAKIAHSAKQQRGTERGEPR